ncbi:MAG: hypothetical protein F4Z30_10205 [Gemmatimonadetes bacterium]|nr:hypothetical protein [Gemmatimonadota bacterium]
MVVANPTGKDKVLEVAGGSRPPTRNYCPAEGNDSPTRARRDEWSLYLSVCEAGDTEIVIFDYEQTELARYAIQVAEAEGQFNIVLLFDDLVPEDEKILFLQAADLWEEVIVGDIPDITLPEWWSSDSDLTPDNSSIDDLHISIHHIDYHPSIAGASGGPLFLREGSSLPATGAIWYESDELREHYKQNEHFFESAFLAQNARENQIRQMALHEIGHVLGFGTIPNWHKLLADIGEQWGGAKGATGDDAHFTDPNTIEAFNALPGPIFKGSPVPTNRSGVHWRGLILPEDVMGGHGSPAVKRISTVTLESLASLGYEVDLSKVGEIQRWENGYPLFFEEGYDPTRDQPPYSFPYSSKPVAAQITPIWTCTVGKE